VSPISSRGGFSNLKLFNPVSSHQLAWVGIKLAQAFW
jgi:hypothetical protein